MNPDIIGQIVSMALRNRAAKTGTQPEGSDSSVPAMESLPANNSYGTSSVWRPAPSQVSTPADLSNVTTAARQSSPGVAYAPAPPTPQPAIGVTPPAAGPGVDFDSLVRQSAYNPASVAPAANPNAIRVDGMGVPVMPQSNNLQSTVPQSRPLSRTPDPNRTYGGMDRPQLGNDKYQKISRGRSLAEGLIAGLQHGGIAGGLGGAIVGLLSKGAGRGLEYGRDTARFDAEKMNDLAQDRQDPAYMEEIATKGAMDRIPATQAIYSGRTAGQLAVVDRRQQGQMKIVDANNTARLARVQQKDRDLVNRDADRYTAQILLTNPNMDPDEARANGAQMALNDHDAKLEKTNAQTTEIRQRGDSFVTRAKQNQQRIDIAARRQTNAETQTTLRGLAQNQGDLAKRHSELMKVVANKLAPLTDRQQAMEDLDDLESRQADLESQVGAATGTTIQPQKPRTVKPGAPGQGTEPKLTPQQESDYQSRKAKYPQLTREQYQQYLREQQH